MKYKQYDVEATVHMKIIAKDIEDAIEMASMRLNVINDGSREAKIEDIEEAPPL